MANITLGTPTIDKTRTIITVPISGATGALTIGDAPGISVSVGGNAMNIGTPTTTGTGASAKVILTTEYPCALGKTIAVTAVSSSIVDASSDTLSDGTVDVSDPASAAQSVLSASVQKALSAYAPLRNLMNGIFGNVVCNEGGQYSVYGSDNQAVIASIIGSEDTAGNITIHHVTLI